MVSLIHVVLLDGRSVTDAIGAFSTGKGSNGEPERISREGTSCRSNAWRNSVERDSCYDCHAVMPCGDF